MAKPIHKLTDLYLKSKGKKPGKHFDGGGLYLEVKPTGARIWRVKYRLAGVENRYTIGPANEVTLPQARAAAAAVRDQVRNGINPNAAKADRAAATLRDDRALFPKVAADWLAKMKPGWAEGTHRQAVFIVDSYLSPALRRQRVTDLTTKEAARALESIAEKAPALAAKARGYLGRIVRHAIRHGLRDEGRILAWDKDDLPKLEKGHIPAAIELADVRAVVKAVAAYPTPVTRAALTVAMLTAQRPGNVVEMEWGEVDLDAKEWAIPAGKMKMRAAHVVPLSRQAVEALRGMLAYTDGRRFVFPPLARQRTEHLHRDALSGALRKSGLQGKHAAHGFRAMFRTLARDRLHIPADVLEAQLAHAKKDEIQRAYDRTTFVEQRHKVMQQWADYLDAMLADDGAKVTPIKRKA